MGIAKFVEVFAVGLDGGDEKVCSVEGEIYDGSEEGGGTGCDGFPALVADGYGFGVVSFLFVSQVFGPSGVGLQ